MGTEIYGGMTEGSDGDWMTWGDDIGAAIAFVGTQFGDLGPKVDAAKAKLQEYRDGATEWLGSLPGAVGGWFSEMAGGALSWGSQMATDAGDWASTALDNTGTFLSELPGNASSWFGGMFDNAASFLGLTSDEADAQAGMTAQNIDSGLSPIPGLSEGWFGRMVDGASRQGGVLAQWAGNLPGIVVNGLGDLGNLLWNSGASLVDGFLQGISRNWDRITGWVSRGMTNLRSLWPFSPAKTGPFSGTGYVTYSGAALTNDFAESLRAGTPGIIESAQAAMAATRAVLSGRSGEIRSSIQAGLTLPPGAALGGLSGGQVVQKVEHHYHIAGTVVAERQLMELVQTGASRFAGRNTTNGLTGRG